MTSKNTCCGDIELEDSIVVVETANTNKPPSNEEDFRSPKNPESTLENIDDAYVLPLARARAKQPLQKALEDLHQKKNDISITRGSKKQARIALIREKEILKAKIESTFGEEIDLDVELGRVNRQIKTITQKLKRIYQLQKEITSLVEHSETGDGDANIDE